MYHLYIRFQLIKHLYRKFPRLIRCHKSSYRFALIVLIVILLVGQAAAGTYSLVLGNCTAENGGGIYGKEFWEMRAAMQGVLVHNYIFEMWADMGFLALGAGIDANIKARVRPDFYFDGVIRDIKPLAEGKNKADVVAQYRDQFKKYVETAFELNGGAYYPQMEVIFYQLDHDHKAIRIIEDPYQVDLQELGIDASGRTRSSLLSELSNFLGTVGNLRAAVYDKKQKQVIFFGETTEKKSNLQPDDCLIAAHAVFNTEYMGAMVTIDPDPENLETRGIVRYGGDIEGTHVGEVLFESDRLLKCLGQGYDNHQDQPLTSQVDGYKPMQDLISEEEISQQKQEWIRFWFMPVETEVAFSDYHDIIVFPKNLMTVKTENMKFDGRKLVSDFTPDPSSPQGRFAAHFNAHLDDFAAELPVFRELQEVAKMIAFFNWLYDREIDLDLNYLDQAELRKVPYYEYTPLIKSTRTMTRERKEKNYLRTEMITSTLMGGVDLQHFNFKEISAQSLESLVSAILQNPDNVPFKYGDVLCMRRFFATPSIPNVQLRQVIHENYLDSMPPEIREKIRLALDQYGRVMVYTDAENYTYYFEYDNAGRMISVRGWDQPIAYQYSNAATKIAFKYEMFTNTNEYLKHFHYAPGSDQIERIEIFKNNQLQHAFSVRVEEDDVIVERECGQ